MPAVILTLIAVLIYASPTLTEALQWTRGDDAISSLWTAHLTHWTSGHLLWDAVMFAAFGLIAARAFGLRLLAAFFIAAPVITLGVAHWAPELTSYRGLSGIDTLLVVFVSLKILCDAKHARSIRVAAITLLLGLAGKTLFEAVTHGALFAGDLGPGVTTVPLAHLIGGMIGAALVFTPTPLVRMKKSPPQRGLCIAKQCGDGG